MDTEESGQQSDAGGYQGGHRTGNPVLHGHIPELQERTSSSSRLDPPVVDLLRAGRCSVVLNRMEMEEDDQSDDGEKKDRDRREDGEKESRRAGRASSRIPTFQSLASRRRPTGQGLDSTVPSPVVKAESSSIPAQPRVKSSSGGAKASTTRETALPVPSLRLPIGSVEAGLSIGFEELPNCPLEPALSRYRMGLSAMSDSATSDPLQSHPPILIPRPALRAESAPQLLRGLSAVLQEFPVSEESQDEVDKLEEIESEVQTETGASGLQVCGELLEATSVDLDSAMQENENCCDDESTPVSTCELAGEESSSDDRGKQSQSMEPEAEEAQSHVMTREQGPCRKMMVGGRPEEPKGEVHPRKGYEMRQASLLDDGQPLATSTHPGSKSRLSSQRPPRTCGLCSPLSCLILSSVLLLGGLGLHLWRYGTPCSMSQLLVQLQLDWLESFWGTQDSCSSDCSFSLVESLPEGLQFGAGSPTLPPISGAWLKLLSQANRTVSIAAFYFTLRATDLGLQEPSALEGEQVFNQLMQLKSKGVELQIAVNSPQSYPQDTADLAAAGAEVREVDLQSVTGGILHTKLWVVDGKHFYVGSANMDWRSLTQVKEVGVSVENCSCLAEDAARLFGIYWHIGAHRGSPLPPYWPVRYSAHSNAERPLRVKLNGIPAHVYLSSAPRPLEAHGRTDDLSAILSVISDARRFVFISVMDYLPFSSFSKPPRFWPAIDSALRDVACSKAVEVRLLVSCWPHSQGAMFVFLQSLQVLSHSPLSCPIQVKVFKVPSTEELHEIPFARVNHAKYMVTDRVAYIGTSNWSENYFTQTAGVGLVVNQTGFVVGPDQHTVQSRLHEVFERDWNSEHTHILSDEHLTHCRHLHSD
ncbi:phospholipase D4 [Scleropages formosus]|uniref:Phospholipase D family, member 7 n=1 Tax=Scleropages formosus TaxID=113540 RepID=A0A8C9QZ57_SCLFO|nr:phospholipase D4-like [Scleropages formosus]